MLEARNIVEPYEGKFEIDKEFLGIDYEDLTDLLEDEDGDGLTFTFDVVITSTGDFVYEGTTYGEENDYTLTFTVELGIDNAVDSDEDGLYDKLVWQSSTFYWYGEDNAPQYTITEILSEESDDENEESPLDSYFECVGDIEQSGSLLVSCDPFDTDEEEEEEEIYTVVIFTNKPKETDNYLHIDKTFLDDSEPEEGEVFYVTVTIIGKFAYDDADGDGDVDGDGKVTIYDITTYTDDDPYIIDNIELSSDNDWSWTSEKIIWLSTSDAPTYTVVEEDKVTTYDGEETEEGTFEEMHWEYVSTTDQTTTSTTNEFESTLEEGHTYVIITNQKEEKKTGYIEILKLAETEIETETETDDESFYVTLMIELEEGGEFEYTTIDGTTTYTYSYSDSDVEYYYDYVNDKFTTTWSQGNDIQIQVGETYTLGEFSWYEDDGAPAYTVTETLYYDQVNAGIEIVSIANNSSTVSNVISDTEDGNETETIYISGSLAEDETEVIKIINKGPNTSTGKISLTKVLTGDVDLIEKAYPDLEDDLLTFEFTVEITGEFYYGDSELYNGTYYLTNDGISEDETSVVRLQFDLDELDEEELNWTSSEITWPADSYAPTYVVTENITTEQKQSGIDVVSSSNSSSTNSTNVISGSISSDVETTLVITNDVTIEEHTGQITLIKESQTDNLYDVDEALRTFEFTVAVTGEFYYGDDSETFNGTYYLTNDGISTDETSTITLTLGDDADEGVEWNSEEFVWYGNSAPTYTIVENLTEEQTDEGISLVDISNNTSNLLVDGTSTILAVNQMTVEIEQGRIQITKKYYDATGNENDGVDFYFKIVVTYEDGTTSEEYACVSSGNTYRSSYFYWKSTETEPTYEVTEVNVPDNTSVNLTNSEGSLEKYDPDYDEEDDDDSDTNGGDGLVEIIATNTNTTAYTGQISITKSVVNEDKVALTDITGTFVFEVTVSGTFSYEGTTYINDSILLKITISYDGGSENTWTSGTFTWWDEDNPPQYGIEEVSIESGYSLESIEGSYGTLSAGGTSSASATNIMEANTIVKLTMEIGGKVWNDTDYSDGKLTDTGENGTIDDGESGIEGVKVTVYRVIDYGDGTVERISGALVYDENNNLTSVECYTYTDSNGNWSFGAIAVPALEDSSATVTYDIEFSYDGQTYEPTTYLEASGVEVTDVETALSAASTYIESSTSARDEYLLDSMAIDDPDDRIAFNTKFATIGDDTIGNESMDLNGETTGTTSGGVTLNYTSTDSISLVNSDNTRKISTLETYDDKGYIYEDLVMEATTSTGGLTYPFDDQYQLESWDKEIDLYGNTVTTYNFTATYNYMLNINLGLIEREYADVSLEKDLTEATVVINGTAIKYKYNSSIDFDNLSSEEAEELLYKQIAVSDEEIEYTLGLYASDYYYRAAIYETDETLSEQLIGYYVDTLQFESLADALELDVYLTYTIIVHNESETYDVTINKIADYFDESLELIADEEDSIEYISTLNDTEINSTVYIAENPTVTYYSAGGSEQAEAGVTWSEEGSVTDSTDGTVYNIYSVELTEKLESGGYAEIVTTYKINKDNADNGVTNALILGEKSNIAEVASFTAYYADGVDYKWEESSYEGAYVGRVDKDSAPDNVNITELNDKTYYEDDTDKAPRLTVELNEDSLDREINGLVWEDAQTSEVLYSQVLGDGLYNPDDGDKTISGMTTEIVESVSIPTGETDSDGNAIYIEYDFIWPTEKTDIDGLNGYSLEQLTGFDSTVTTDSSGQYEFTAIPSGNYKIRFVYGDTYIETGNTDDEVVYNGQDYKSTSYQVGYSDSDSDGNGYTDNEWHDLENDDLNTARVSDARDSEARRLYISSKSEILIYDNTSILALADEFLAETDENGEIDDSAYDELFGYGYDSYGNSISGYEAAKNAGDVIDGNGMDDDEDDSAGNGDTGYYMFAETAKIDLDIEAVYDLECEEAEIRLTDGTSTTVTYATDGDVVVGVVSSGNDFSYVVSNIDFGIEERSQTKLTLDKQIKEIILTTSDGEVVLDAVYDIVYELSKDSDEIGVSVTLNEDESTGYDNIASLNRSSGTQGYRYIMAEGTILQGATIEVQYQLTVFNVGEADTCTELLQELWRTVNGVDYNPDADDNALDVALEELTSPYYTKEKRLTLDQSGIYEYGTYFGSVYYLGTDAVTDDGEYVDKTILVTSTIRQIIDYVDPDIEFVDTDNLSENQSWATTSIEDLINDGLIDPEAIIVVDSEGNPVLLDTDGDGNYDTIKTYAYVLSGGSFDESSENYTFLSDNVQQYISDTRNNVIVSIDETIDGEATINPNPDLVTETIPYSAALYETSTPDEAEEMAMASIKLQVSRYYSSEEDTAEIDNIAEIIKIENIVGRRDIRTVAGNTKTYQIDWDEAENYTEKEDIITTTRTIYDIAQDEPDTNAAELITLTPPTGSDTTLDLIMKVLAGVGFVGVILVIVIVFIKKKFLKRKL